jgi:hypothetical protein
MAGIITKEEMMRFNKLVFRSTHGKALTYFEDLITEKKEERIDYTGHVDRRLRTVYVIVFQEGVTIRAKLTKICDSF